MSETNTIQYSKWISNLVIAKDEQPVYYPIIYRNSDRRSFCVAIKETNVRRFVFDTLAMAIQGRQVSKAESDRQSTIYARAGLEGYACMVGISSNGQVRAFGNFCVHICDNCWLQRANEEIEELLSPPRKESSQRVENKWRSSLSFSEDEIRNLNRTIWTQRILRGKDPLLFLEIERMNMGLIADVEAHQDNQLAIVCETFPPEIHTVKDFDQFQ